MFSFVFDWHRLSFSILLFSGYLCQYLRQSSASQHMADAANLCLLSENFSSLTFNVLTDIFGLTDIMSPFCFLFLYFFWGNYNIWEL